MFDAGLEQALESESIVWVGSGRYVAGGLTEDVAGGRPNIRDAARRLAAATAELARGLARLRGTSAGATVDAGPRAVLPPLPGSSIGPPDAWAGAESKFTEPGETLSQPYHH